MSNSADKYKEMIEELNLEGQKICQIIHKKIGDVPLEIIAKTMGYAKPEKGVERIKKTINDPGLGLLESNYDGLYSSVTFIDKLLEVIGLNDERVNKHIEKINEEKFDKDFGFRPWIFIDTNFKRTWQGIFSLMGAQSLHHIYFPKNLKKLSREEKIKFVREFIKKHYKKNNGVIEVWGTVVKYVCHFEKDEAIEFLPDGTIISEKHEPVLHSAACLKIGNKVLAGCNP